MPVVIEEMTVQVEVNQGAGAPPQNGSGATPAQAAGNPEMIRQCVEEVMEVIRHQNER